MSKVLATMHAVDQANWGLLTPTPDRPAGEVGGANVRVCEYHMYTEGGEVCDPRHRDGGSLVTMSVLLAHRADFEGGDFTTLEEDGSVTEFEDFERGDGIVFVSEKCHSVEVGRSKANS